MPVVVNDTTLACLLCVTFSIVMTTRPDSTVSMSVTCQLHVSYMSVTCQLHVSYMSVKPNHVFLCVHRYTDRRRRQFHWIISVSLVSKSISVLCQMGKQTNLPIVMPPKQTSVIGLTHWTLLRGGSADCDEDSSDCTFVKTFNNLHKQHTRKSENIKVNKRLQLCCAFMFRINGLHTNRLGGVPSLLVLVYVASRQT